ncbi:MAG: hypothetical protein ACLFRU_09020 [Paracoccaceae bacterium]
MSYPSLLVLSPLLAAVMLGGCAGREESEGQGAGVPTTAVIADAQAATEGKGVPGAVASSVAGAESVDALIAARTRDYERVRAEARQHGIAGGALRGALLGLLLDSAPAAVLGGAVVGGMLGATTADTVASNLVRDHRNYLIRRWSLEQVLEAAREDTANTRFDLLLSERVVRERGEVVARDRTLGALSLFRKKAVARVLTLREVLPVYAEQANADSTLRLELRKQLDMISRLEENLAKLGGQT